MCLKSDGSTMTNSNSDRFYKEFNKFTRRKDQNYVEDVIIIINNNRLKGTMRPDMISCQDTSKLFARDLPTNTFTCNTIVQRNRCATMSVNRFSFKFVNSSLIKCVVIVTMLLSTMTSIIEAHSSIGHVDDKVQNYLMNFGYLPKSNLDTGNLRSEEQLVDAIKSLQKFGNIPVTGRIDKETEELLMKPRCGLPDSPQQFGSRWKRFTPQGNTWNHTDLTWSLQRFPYNLDSGRIRGELARALAVWSDNSRLTFHEINSDKADIVVSFFKGSHNDGYPFDGRGQILAHAFFPGNGRGGDAHFDEEEIWLLRDADEEDEGTSLFAVAAHEFGHSLGLQHSSVQGALMYPWYQRLDPNFQLPQDDRLGIQYMYGVKEQKVWRGFPSNLPPELPKTTTTTTTTTTLRPYRPERPRYPNDRYPEYPKYPTRPTTRPTPPSYYPERNPEHPRRKPVYTERPYPRPNPQQPDKPPEYPKRTPTHHNPFDKYPVRPVHTTPKVFTRPHEHPTRRTHKYPHPEHPGYRPDYPGYRPDYPSYRPDFPGYRPEYPHVTRKPNYPPATEMPHYPHNPKPELPKKPHYPKKTHHLDKSHRPSYPESKPKDGRSSKPDTCNTDYDAIALIRREVFIFKSQYLWRIDDRRFPEGFPTLITNMWSELPENLTHVDAVYERPDSNIVFFIGRQYYVFNSSRLEKGYPRPLTDLGLPATLDHLNAAMVWGHNGRTYFYNETMYWKFDEDVRHVELDYPRDMSMWKGVGYDIDTVFQWKDGKTYFFKGKGFWKFNDLSMRVEHEKQKPSAQFWMRCPPTDDNNEDFLPDNKQPYTNIPSPTGTLYFASANTNYINHNILILYCVQIFFTLNIYLT